MSRGLRRVATGLAVVAASVLAVACSEPDAEETSPTASTTTAAALTNLDYCRISFRQAQESPVTSSPPEPYLVCSHEDFFRVTLEEAQRGAPGYDGSTRWSGESGGTGSGVGVAGRAR